MADSTVTIDLELNASKALDSVQHFKEDVDSKLPGSIETIQQYVDAQASGLANILSSLGENDPFKGFASSIINANTAIMTMQKTLKTLSSVLARNDISDGMTRMFESSYRTMLSSIKTINDEVDKGFKARTKSGKPKKISPQQYAESESSIQTAIATGLSASQDMKNMMRIFHKNETGLTSEQIGNLVPALNSIVRTKVDDYRRTTRSTPRLNELASYVSNSNIFKETVKSGSFGYTPSDKELQALAKSIIISTRNGSYRDNESKITENIKKQAEHMFVTDQLPSAFKDAYINYGRPGATSAPVRSGATKASNQVYGAFRKLVQNGNQQAIQYGLDVGLLRSKNGRYLFSGSANLAQIDTMAGMAARSVADAKTSLPYYFTNRNDQSNQKKLLERQNNIFQDALEVMEALSVDPNLRPDVYGYVKDIKDIRNNPLFGFDAFNKTFKSYNRKSPKIKTLGTNSQYVVPKTTFDKDGNLIWRDPSWRKLNGVQEQEDDEFATIGNSAFTHMLGMHGNNTYGYGRNEEGEAIYGTPKVIRIGTSGLYKQVRDKSGTRMVVDPEKKAEAERINRIFSRKETVKYGKPGSETEYIAAFGDSGSITMIQKADYDSIVNKFASRGMANPFNNMNVGGLFRSGDYENASKQIDLSRKKATPGKQYAMLGYGTNTPTAALVDFENLYNFLGIPEADQQMRTTQRIDGVSFFDPTVLGINAQMRSAAVGKFMGQALDWRKLLNNSGLLKQAYESNRNRALIDFDKQKGYSFYMPQIGLKSVSADWLNSGLGRNSLDEISLLDKYEGGKLIETGLITEMNRLANGSEEDKKLLQRIRDTYFYDIMDKKYQSLITESTVKNNDKFRIISKDAFKKGGLFENENNQWARDLGNNTVELTADQQRRYYEETSKMMGGLWVSKTAQDFRTDKNFIPESLAAAMGADVGALKEESLANYDEYISRLRTDTNARINFLKSTPMGRRLVREGQWNSDTANSLLQAHINDMESKREQQHLFLPGQGVENLLTGVNPGSVFGNIFERGFGAKVSDNSMYRKLFSYGNDEDKIIMKTLSENEQESVRRNARAAKYMLSRMPAGPGEFGSSMSNLGDHKTIQRALDALGIDYDDTVFTNPSLQYTLMTGDYDGDTAWVIRGLSENVFERMTAIQEYMKNAREKLRSQQPNTKAEKVKRKLENDLDAFTNFGADHGTAQLGMGQSTAAIRNALADMDDTDPEKWIAIAEAIDAYDRQTSEAMKEGQVVKLGEHASRKAMEGALFRRFVKEINAYGQGSQGAHPNLFSTRLPEIKDTATLFDIASNFSRKARGDDVGSHFARSLDDWMFNQYGNSNSFEAQAARHYAGIFKNIETGTRLASVEDISKGRNIAIDWQRQIDIDRKAGVDNEQIKEEQSKLNSYVRRLNQAESSGSLYDDFKSEYDRLEKQREELISSGVSEFDQRVVGIDKKREIYSKLLTPQSAAFEKAKEEWEKEYSTFNDEVKARVESNSELARKNGIILDDDVVSMLGPILSQDISKNAALNWSDNSPWTYTALKNRGFTLKGIRKSTLNNLNGSLSVTDDLVPKEANFFPYPHDINKLEDAKSTIIAKEMDVAEKFIPHFDDSAAALMGTLRHEAFATTLEAIAKGSKNIDISTIYEGLLSSTGSGGGKFSERFKDLGLKLKRNENTGEYSIEGATNLNEGLNRALGSYIVNGNSGQYINGSLANFMMFINQTLANGGRIANIEGFNIGANGERLNATNTDYSGRGTLFSKTIIDPNTGNKIVKNGTFAPDLIMQEGNNGMFTMYDYKSGEQGAYDSLFQMAVYAKDIEEKAKSYHNAGTEKERKEIYEDLKNKGWLQYIDEATGQSKIKTLRAFDTSTSDMYTWDVNNVDVNEINAAYEEAIAEHSFGSEIDRVKAIAKLKAAVAQKYGATVQKATPMSNAELVKAANLGASTGKGSWYDDYIGDKLNKDEETISKINSFAYKAKQRYTNTAEGGASQFAYERRELEDTLSDEVISNLQNAAAMLPDRDENGNINQDKVNMLASITRMQQQKQFARSNLNEAELYAVQNGYKDIDSFIQQQFYGVKKNSALESYNAVEQRFLNMASTREGLKQNKEAYNDATGEWTSLAHQQAYENSLKAEKTARDAFSNMLPQMQEQALKDNKATLENLLADTHEESLEEKISSYYEKKYKEIEAYVKQQQADINSFSEKLSQTDRSGNLVLKEGSKEREFFQNLLDDAVSNSSTAMKALKDSGTLQKRATETYERELFGEEGKKTKAEKQKEYLDNVKKKYDEAVLLTSDEKIAERAKAQQEAEMRGDTEEAARLKNELENAVQTRRALEPTMKKYDSYYKKYELEKEKDVVSQRSSAIKARSLLDYLDKSGYYQFTTEPIQQEAEQKQEEQQIVAQQEQSTKEEKNASRAQRKYEKAYSKWEKDKAKAEEKYNSSKASIDKKHADILSSFDNEQSKLTSDYTSSINNLSKSEEDIKEKYGLQISDLQERINNQPSEDERKKHIEEQTKQLENEKTQILAKATTDANLIGKKANIDSIKAELNIAKADLANFQEESFDPTKYQKERESLNIKPLAERQKEAVEAFVDYKPEEEKQRINKNYSERIANEWNSLLENDQTYKELAEKWNEDNKKGFVGSKNLYTSKMKAREQELSNEFYKPGGIDETLRKERDAELAKVDEHYAMLDKNRKSLTAALERGEEDPAITEINKREEQDRLALEKTNAERKASYQARVDNLQAELLNAEKDYETSQNDLTKQAEKINSDYNKKIKNLNASPEDLEAQKMKLEKERDDKLLSIDQQRKKETEDYNRNKERINNEKLKEDERYKKDLENLGTGPRLPKEPQAPKQTQTPVSEIKPEESQTVNVPRQPLPSEQVEKERTLDSYSEKIQEEARYRASADRVKILDQLSELEKYKKDGKFEDKTIENLYNSLQQRYDNFDEDRQALGYAQSIEMENQNLEMKRELELSSMYHQNDMAEAQRQRMYEQQNRNSFGHSRSRLVNRYRQLDDIRFGLQQSAKQNSFLASQTSALKNAQEKTFEQKYKISYGDYSKLTSEQKQAFGKNAAVDAQNISKAQASLEGYQKAAADAESQSQKFTPALMSMKAAFSSVAEGATMVARRFGRQMFQKALAEAKRFVKEFNQQMTTIQMITLKSDSEMATLGDSLISKSKELKISVSEISQSAATLYRQGLSDEEVNERLDVISKFSKVSGTKVDAATKLVTVAMNTGLVSDAQVAADVVTALGDNAATNASEIEKGIEKAGAAAAADGTTFEELASMLTAITSTTQIGGNVAGRTLNTIFGRMNKIGTNELIYDENGNAISGSAVAELLRAQGINMYDENGNKRSSYDTLYALSQRWDKMSDAEQQQIANAIAGTRQYSNFSAIMQGMSEGKVDEYMKLAGESSGITDEKYGIYTQSLEASLIDLRNTFDEVIKDLVDKGYVQDFLEGITTMINGVDTLVESFGGLRTTLPIVMTLLGALSGAQLGPLGALLGAIAGLGTYATLTALGEKNDIDFDQANLNYRKEQINATKGDIEKARSLYAGYRSGELSDSQKEEFDNVLSKIGNSFSEAEKAAFGLGESFETVSERLDAYADALAEKEKQETEQQIRKANSTDLTDIVESKYESESGKTYTDIQQSYKDYITNNFSKDGNISWQDKELQDYMREIVYSGLAYDGTVTDKNSFLGSYSDKIYKWMSEGQFVQGWKQNGDEYVPISYTNLQDMYRDFIQYDFEDENGNPNQNAYNLQKLFNLIMGQSLDENYDSQMNFAEDVVRSTYGDRLRSSLTKAGYIDKDFADLITDAYIDNVMSGVEGEILAANATGEEANIPGRINDESNRLLGDMYGLFTAKDPTKAFQDYVIASRLGNRNFLEEYSEQLKDLSDDEKYAFVRNMLFPKAPTLKDIEAEEIAADIFHAGASTGYSSWSNDKSNMYGLKADEMIGMLSSAGVADINSLQSFLKTTDGKQWKYLVENNGELAQIVNSAQYDENGNVINGNQVYQQIMDTLYGNSRTYGARYISNKEKAENAQNLLTSLTSGETGYFSWEDALSAAEQVDKANRDEYEKGIQNLVEARREESKGKFNDEDLEIELAKYERSLREQKPYTGLDVENIAAGYRIYTKEEQKYLKETVGDELYDKLISKNGLTASEDEIAYANQLIENRRYGLQGLTSRQQGDWIDKNYYRLSSLGAEDGLSRNVADAYMSQWSRWSEYARLTEKKNTYGLTDEEKKQLSELKLSFENFRKQTKINLELTGVQELEEAGRVAKGTAEQIERLRSGGKITLETEVQIRSSAYSSGQQRAKLYNGKDYEQDAIAMSLLGMSEEEYYGGEGRAAHLEQAKMFDEWNLQFDKTYWEELYDKSTNKSQVKEWAKLAGFKEGQEQGTFKYVGTDVDELNLQGAFSLAGSKYRETNKAGLAADAIFTSLAKIDPSSADAFSQLITSVNTDQARNWKELISSSPEIAKKLTDLGVAVGEDGLDFSALQNSTISTAEVLSVLMQAAAGAAATLNEFKEVSSTGETFDKAMAYLNGEAMADSAAGLEALSSVYGNQNLAQIVTNNRINAGLNKPGSYIDSNGLARDANGNVLYDENDQVIKYDKYAGLSDYNREYAEQLEQNAQYGISGLTDMQRLEQLQKIINAAQNGGLANLRNQDKIGQFADVTSGIEGFEQWEHAVEAIQAAGLNLSDFNEDSDEFKKAIESTGISVKDFADINEDMTETIRTKTMSTLKSYGKESEKVAAIYKKLTGTAEEQLEAEQQMAKNRLNLANSTYYTSGAGSKDFRKVAKDFLGYSKEELAVLEKQQGQEGAKIEIERQAKLKLEIDQQQVINDANAVIQSTLDSIPDVDYNDVLAKVSGTYDISGLQEMASNLEGDAKAVLEALIAALESLEGEVTITGEASADGTTGHISVHSSGSGLRSSGGGHKTGGGGGGGGKSELDKLLERQKNQIAEIEHNNKILQTLYQGLDFVNDYGGMNANIDQQIASQESLRQAYITNIAELENQLASLEQGSDDWYKATQALWQYQEALTAINNTINQLRSAKITILEQKQEYENGPKNHKGTILEKRAQRYQMTNRVEAYNETMQASIDNTRQQIVQNENQIKEWENLLAKTIKNSDDWYKIRDKIWQKKQENEQLYNDALQAEIDLDKARIDQIATDLEQATINSEHMNNMLSTFSGMYESTFNYDKYQASLQKQTDNLEKMKIENEEAIEELKKQIDSMAQDDPAREYAIQVLYQLEEQNAQMQAEILQNEQSIQESYINEIEHSFDERHKNITHESKLLDEELKKYQRVQDYINQENILSEQARNKQDEINLQEQELAELEALMSSGKITEGSKQWYDLQDLIFGIRESVAQLNNELAETEDQIAQTHFENILDIFHEGNEHFVGMDQLQHERNLIGYQKTRYQNRGELTNVGRMLEFDQSVIAQEREATNTQIETLKQFKDTIKDNPELYDKVTQEIRKQEEELEKLTNEYEQTTKAIEQNQEAIRQARMKVENEADKAIRSIIQKQRNMLSATVSIQNTILDNIRNYHKEQWDLEKKTIEKKKQALNEEKNLLSEQLNYKRRMMDQESKEEELAEYKRQLALISADTTRTKDANELRHKINEMEKEMAIQNAQDIANAEIKSIDERSKGWDDYVSVQEEDLNNMLSNANNFRELIDKLMNGSFEDFVAWNAKINKSYKNATDEQKEQMEQGWDDTWYNMLGWLKTYWEEVDEVSRSKDGFLALLMSTDEYNSKSDTGKESYLYNARTMWDNFYKSTIDNAEFSDTHDILNTLTELKDWTFNVKLSNPQDLYVDGNISQYTFGRNHAGADPVSDDLYSGWGVDYVPPAPAPAPEPTPPPSGGGGGGGGGGTRWDIRLENGRYVPYQVAGGPYVSREQAQVAANHQNRGLAHDEHEKEPTFFNKVWDLITSSSATTKFASGGLVDYTGPAWVDGTKSRPEAFLNPDDTALLRNMLDAFTYVKTSPYITHLDQSNFGQGGVNIGDVNVNLYEAKLENDADYDLIARKVGNAFTKQLQKDGFNLAGYAW